MYILRGAYSLFFVLEGNRSFYQIEIIGLTIFGIDDTSPFTILSVLFFTVHAKKILYFKIFLNYTFNIGSFQLKELKNSIPSYQ